ncbi:LuxR C-terminal-related transcriptional regulator [Pedobacter sp. P351]|uniref:helix-turn-helix transcriptional regulator n=1 Tax=Pedobacter superstes TaxID=3133441 RepID=UPI003098E994
MKEGDKLVDSEGTHKLSEKISEKINEIHELATDFPCVIIIHHVKDFSIEYMSPKGLSQLGISLEELRSIKSEEYHARYFNEEDSKDYVPKLRKLMEQNTDESISFFQQVRINQAEEWIWHCSSMKILMRDENNNPLLTITTSSPIDPKHHNTTKIQRLLDENTFLKKHYLEFSSMTMRERDILRVIAVGMSSAEIAKQMNISVATVDTHRRNIRRKLNAGSSYDLAQYARAFDLI